jgi:hypothetical protein
MHGEAQPQDESSPTPIADLVPDSDNAHNHIVAQVALVWPYSSSTNTLALLLADTDVRRRKSKGQVKVIFRYGCAREVAKTKVGIGDVIKLGLEGCAWTETGDAVSTPGRRIDWDLEYHTRIVLRVLRDGRQDIAVDYTTNGVNGIPHNVPSPRPPLQQLHHSSAIQVPYLTPRKPLQSTPAWTFVDLAWDTTTEDDGYIPGQGRKRTKFARHSGAWSLVDTEEEPASGALSGAPLVLAEPTEQTQADDKVDGPNPNTGATERVLIQDEAHETADMLAEVSETSTETVDTTTPLPATSDIGANIEIQPTPMGPPATPFRPLRLEQFPESLKFASADATTTPRLFPIPSPGLPLVSPLVQRTGVETGYFPHFSTGSLLDATGNSTSAVLEEDAGFLSQNGINIPSPAIPVPLQPEAEVATSERGSGVIGTHHDDSTQNLPLVAREATGLDTTTAVQPFSAQQLQLEEHLSIETSHISPRHSQSVEDEDMYGPPTAMRDSAASEPGHPLSGRLESPPDVVEQYLQMSPTAPVSPVPAHRVDSPTNSSPTTIGTSQQPPMSNSVLALADKAPSSALSYHSSSTYPEPQSPFRQGRDYQSLSSTSSRRSSSQLAQMQAVDGVTEEKQPFAEYIDHLSQIAASAMTQQQAPGVVAATSYQRELETESNASAVFDVAKPPVSVDCTSATSATPEGHIEAIADPQVSDGLEHVPASPRPVVLVDSVVQPEHSTLTQFSESQIQLPTPDLSQLQRFSPEPEPKSVGRQSGAATEVAPPSPQNTQEIDIEDQVPRNFQTSDHADSLKAPQSTNHREPVDQDNLVPAAEVESEYVPLLPEPIDDKTALPEKVQEPSPAVSIEQEPWTEPQPDSAAATLAPGDQNLVPDSSAPRRVSQRLSARKSMMTSTLSSPYFKPLNPNRARSTSPNRKENVHFATPDRVEPFSSPIPKKTKKPPSLPLTNSNERRRVNPTLTSPDSTVKRTFRRSVGAVTPLAYYAPLEALDEHFGQTVDILGVCTSDSSSPLRSRTGPKDHHTTLHLADSSMAKGRNNALVAQVFRPAKSALPESKTGDVVMLRDFKVQSSNRKIMLLSTGTSSWAVFKASPESATTWSEVIVTGPPIEYGHEETDQVKALLDWWHESGKTQFSSARSPSEDVDTSSPETLNRSFVHKEAPQPRPKAAPITPRRVPIETNNTSSEDAVQNFLATFGEGNGGSVSEKSMAEDTAINPEVTSFEIATEPGIPTTSPRRSSRRIANRTDHMNNEGEEEVNTSADKRGGSAALSDATDVRRQSIVSMAGSETGRGVTPRRSARQRNKNSPSLVHELRDGTKYVDDDDGSGPSVVHELRDGATYVDE